MTTRIVLLSVIVLLAAGAAGAQTTAPVPPAFIGGVEPPPASIGAPAAAATTQREHDMQSEICAAADSIAERYGNKSYCYIISNDERRRESLRERLESIGSLTRLKKDNEQLQKRNTELAAAIAAKEARAKELENTVAKQQEALRVAAAALAAAGVTGTKQ